MPAKEVEVNGNASAATERKKAPVKPDQEAFERVCVHDSRRRLCELLHAIPGHSHYAFHQDLKEIDGNIEQLKKKLVCTAIVLVHSILPICKW